MPTIDEISDKQAYANLTAPDKQEVRDDIAELSATGWDNLGNDHYDRAIKGAITERNSIYSGLMSRTPTLDGDEETFLLNLAAHKLELAEGGQAESENSGNGSVNYHSGQPDDYLTLTRFGQTALRHVRNDESISIVRSY